MKNKIIIFGTGEIGDLAYFYFSNDSEFSSGSGFRNFSNFLKKKGKKQSILDLFFFFLNFKIFCIMYEWSSELQKTWFIS